MHKVAMSSTCCRGQHIGIVERDGDICVRCTGRIWGKCDSREEADELLRELAGIGVQDICGECDETTSLWPRVGRVGKVMPKALATMSLEELRKQFDKLQRDIIALLEDRGQYSEEIADGILSALYCEQDAVREELNARGNK